MMKKVVLLLTLAGMLTGCASFPSDYKKTPTEKDVAMQLSDSWSATPAITYVPSTNGLAIQKFNNVPDSVLARPVTLAMTQGAGATVDDVVYALKEQGYNISSRLDASKAKEVQLSNFHGSLGKLLKELSDGYNIGYEYRNGALFLVEANRFVVAMPQYKELMDSIATNLTAMGAKNVRVDVQAGQLYYAASPDQAADIADYLEVVGKNSAMIRLQVAVITVTLNRALNQGLDWSQVQAGVGGGQMAPGLQLASTSTVSSSTSTGTGTGSSGSSGSSGSTGSTAGAVASTLVNRGQLLGFNGASGLSYAFTSHAFNLSAAIQALSTYGNTKTDQNVTLGTVSGSPVAISAGNDIPYVSSIGAATTSGGSTSGSSTTAVIKSGLKLMVTPQYDARNNVVTAKVKVDMSSLVGFVNLSAGNNLGTLSQPEMQDLTFENLGMPTVGDTMLVGGITYDQLSKNYTNLPGMEDRDTGSKAEKMTRQAIYIAIRPTVVATVPDIPAPKSHRDASGVTAEAAEPVAVLPAKALSPVKKTHRKAVKPVAKVEASAAVATVPVKPAVSVKPAVTAVKPVSLPPVAPGKPGMPVPAGARPFPHPMPTTLPYLPNKPVASQPKGVAK